MRTHTYSHKHTYSPHTHSILPALVTLHLHKQGPYLQWGVHTETEREQLRCMCMFMGMRGNCMRMIGERDRRKKERGREGGGVCDGERERESGGWRETDWEMVGGVFGWLGWGCAEKP